MKTIIRKGVKKDYPEPYGVNIGTDERPKGSKGYYTGSSKQWYSYIENYDFKKPGALPSETDEQITKNYNKFAQMMWDSTTSVGFSHYEVGGVKASSSF